MLSQEDAKAYWGTITSPDEESTRALAATEESTTDTSAAMKLTPEPESKSAESRKRLEVSGSVLDGWGLEPMPVAHFLLKEVMNELDDEYEEEEEEDFEALSEEIARIDPGIDDEGIIEWPEVDGGSFQ